MARLIAAAADTVAAEVRPGARLHEDLGVDSLEMAALLVDIEHHFGVVITSDMLETVHTVDDLHAAIVRAGHEVRA
ncbi:phosphopantetheine-binding protein [Xanthomonas sp. 60]